MKGVGGRGNGGERERVNEGVGWEGGEEMMEREREDEGGGEGRGNGGERE